VKTIAALLLTAAIAAPALAQDVTEPRTGLKFAAKSGEMSLLGMGVRTKWMFKVYAIGLYVSDSALSGPLAVHKGKTTSPEFYKDLVWVDSPKQVILKFTRNLGQSKIQEAMREALVGADKVKADQFVSYFPEVKEGQECVLSWAPGGTLEVLMAGQAKPAIADKDFAAAVFGIWLRPNPIQDDIKAGLVSRAGGLIK
jgi:hypothetical protein